MNARRRNIVIDLTSLLDVILLLLFLVLSSASGSVSAMRESAQSDKESIARLEDAGAELSEENAKLRRELSGYLYLGEHAKLISVFVENAGNGSRTVRIESGGDESSFSLNWQNEETVRRAVASTLGALCDQNYTDGGDHVTYIILRYDRNRIYQADYAMLSGVIAGIKSTRETVFSAEYDTVEEERKDG